MGKLKVLYISNNHPHAYVGGAEVYSYELYKAMQGSDELEPIFLARTTAPAHSIYRGTVFHAADGNPNEVLWSMVGYDPFLMTSAKKEQYFVHFHQFLQAYRPDLVHIQHTIGLGLDLIRQIKNSLPGTPVIYTLHEFQALCHAEGHMLRTQGGELCQQASPVRCHTCFPDIPPQHFFLRERLVEASFRWVDLFLSPSRFLLRRFCERGIPPEKIRFMENGRVLPERGIDTEEDPPLGKIGFFGQVGPHKGITVLMKAMKLLWQSGEREIRLLLNGGNLEFQAQEFQDEVRGLLEDCAGNTTFRGRYDVSEIPQRMREVAWVVVPSIWWENSPLVIQEAFMNGRPVLCSGLGGMAEKVTHDVDGLHFQAGNAADLAATLRRVAKSATQWKRLRAGIAPVYSIEDAARAHAALYRSLLERAA